MAHATRTTWREGMAFDVELEGHRFTIDADPELGGQGYGPKPKPLVLSALAGCTAMDVVSILGKMRMPFDGFSVDVEGDLTEEHPKHYHRIRILYRFTGAALERAKIDKAIALSQERYCGVTKMLAPSAEISHSVELSA